MSHSRAGAPRLWPGLTPELRAASWLSHPACDPFWAQPPRRAQLAAPAWHRELDSSCSPRYLPCCPTASRVHPTDGQGKSGLFSVFPLKSPRSSEGCWKKEFLPLGRDHEVFMDSLAQREPPVGSPALGSLHSWNSPGIPPAFPELLREHPLLRRSDSPREMLLLSPCCSGIITIIPFSFSSSYYSTGKLGIRAILVEYRAPPGTGAQARSPDPQEEAKCCN